MPSRTSRTCYMCTSKQLKDAKADCSFHKFPTDECTRLKWLHLCNLTPADDTSKLFLCSKHFTSDQFYHETTKDKSYKLTLKKGAFPTLRKPRSMNKKSIAKPKFSLGIPTPQENDVQPESSGHLPTINTSNSSENISASSMGLQNDQMEVDVIQVEMEYQQIMSDTAVVHKRYKEASVQTEMCIPFMEAAVSTEPIHIETVDITKEPSTPKRKRFTEPRYIGDIKTPDIATPKRAKRSLQIAREVVAKQAKKIKALQASNRQMKKKIRSLNELVKC